MTESVRRVAKERPILRKLTFVISWKDAALALAASAAALEPQASDPPAVLEDLSALLAKAQYAVDAVVDYERDVEAAWRGLPLDDPRKPAPGRDGVGWCQALFGPRLASRRASARSTERGCTRTPNRAAMAGTRSATRSEGSAARSASA